MKLIVYTDGGSRGNPGPAGCGAVVLNEQGEELAAISKYVGRQTNNYAEYTAAILGLQKALSFKPESVEMRGDSELLVKQLNGVYRVKNANIKPLFAQLTDLIPKDVEVKFVHVRREYNQRADSLANQAMDRGR